MVILLANRHHVIPLKGKHVQQRRSHALSREAERQQPCPSPAQSKDSQERDPRWDAACTKGDDSSLKPPQQCDALAMWTPLAASLPSPRLFPPRSPSRAALIPHPCSVPRRCSGDLGQPNTAGCGGNVGSSPWPPVSGMAQGGCCTYANTES